MDCFLWGSELALRVLQHCPTGVALTGSILVGNGQWYRLLGLVWQQSKNNYSRNSKTMKTWTRTFRQLRTKFGAIDLESKSQSFSNNPFISENPDTGLVFARFACNNLMNSFFHVQCMTWAQYAQRVLGTHFRILWHASGRISGDGLHAVLVDLAETCDRGRQQDSNFQKNGIWCAPFLFLSHAIWCMSWSSASYHSAVIFLSFFRYFESW